MFGAERLLLRSQAKDERIQRLDEPVMQVHGNQLTLAYLRQGTRLLVELLEAGDVDQQVQ